MTFRGPLAAVLAWCVVSTTAPAQGTLDPLDVAVSFSGDVTVERGKENTNFFISSTTSQVMVSMMNEHAFSPAPNETLSYEWAQRLAKAKRISIVFGDVRDDMKTSKALNEVLMCFTDPAPERKGDDVSYLFQCVAWDMSRVLKREGTQVVEMAVVVALKSGSTADVYLGKPRPENSFVYLRLQN